MKKGSGRTVTKRTKVNTKLGSKSREEIRDHYEKEFKNYVEVTCSCGRKWRGLKTSSGINCPTCGNFINPKKGVSTNSFPCPHCGGRIAFARDKS